jgi:hypothetical protein
MNRKEPPASAVMDLESFELLADSERMRRLASEVRRLAPVVEPEASRKARENYNSRLRWRPPDQMPDDSPMRPTEQEMDDDDDDAA